MIHIKWSAERKGGNFIRSSAFWAYILLTTLLHVFLFQGLQSHHVFSNLRFSWQPHVHDTLANGLDRPLTNPHYILYYIHCRCQVLSRLFWQMVLWKLRVIFATYCYVSADIYSGQLHQILFLKRLSYEDQLTFKMYLSSFCSGESKRENSTRTKLNMLPFLIRDIPVSAERVMTAI